MSALLFAMYADTADYAEWKRGRRATGLIFSASIFAQKQGWGLGSGLSLILMSQVGFVANTAQTESSLKGPPAVEVMDEAVSLLRRTPLSVFSVYYLGALPFWLAFVYFYFDMTQCADAEAK